MPLITLILLFAFVQDAHAYIDPGTGSILISFLISIVITIIYYLKSIFYRSMGFFSSSKKSNNLDFTDQIVIYNEGNNYWHVFKPLVEALCKAGVHFNYLSSDKDDHCREIDSEYCNFLYLGDINKSIIMLNHIKAKIVVMTTPQLEILKLRKSRYVKHYCHLLHAPVDIHTYKKFAFDYFDSVMCTSQFQVDNLRYLESLRNREPKLLLETGCTYYDDFNISEEFCDDYVLVAPTWGDKSALLKHSKDIMNTLLSADFKVIFRPHPQSYISENDKMRDIENEFENHKNFIFDKEISNQSSLGKSRVMIADFSGIVWDYCFLYQRMPIVIDSDQKMYGYEGYDISTRNSIYEIINEIGKIVDEKDVGSIDEIINTVKTDKSAFSAIREKYLFNFQNAGPVAARQLLELNERI
ncbi:MAG: hypothetical protein B6241_01130 [Spirochaetaceae bacterium 4572_59]|nr:MAG: hypothetical protein B6241_01130 [Spirochaetaceae bacterium 4572_59]